MQWRQVWWSARLDRWCTRRRQDDGGVRRRSPWMGALAVALAPLWAAALSGPALGSSAPAAADENFCGDPPRLERYSYGDDTDRLALHPSDIMLFNDEPAEAAQVDVSVASIPVDGVVEMANVFKAGAVVLVCARAPGEDWSQARLAAIVLVPPGTRASELPPVTHSMPELAGQLVGIRIVTIPREERQRSRLSRAIRSTAVHFAVAGVSVVTMGVGTVGLAAAAATWELWDRTVAAGEGDDEGALPVAVRVNVTPTGEVGIISDAPAVLEPPDEHEAQADDIPKGTVPGGMTATDPTGQISAPAQVTVGSSFEVSWAQSRHSRDLVAIVEAGSDEGATGATRQQRDRVGSGTSVTLIAPPQPSRYEVRYLSLEDGPIASAPVEVVDAAISLEIPTQARVGEQFEVAWGDPIHPRDRVVLVPADADVSASGATRHQRQAVGDATSGSLTAPSEPGVHEVRYQLNQGRRVMGEARIEIIDATVTLAAPDQAVAGEAFEVSWGDPIHPRDRIVVVPADSGDSASGATRRQRRAVRGNNAGNLTAPDDPGTHEIRYQLNQDRRVVGRARIEIVPEGTELAVEPSEVEEPEADQPQLTVEGAGMQAATDPTGRISVPDQVFVGSTVWTELHQIDHEHDFVLLVEPGDEDSHEDRYTRMSNRVEDRERIGRRAPIQPGQMEVRYHLIDDWSIAARLPVEIVDAEIEISAPPRVEAGTTFDVTISDVLHSRDYLSIVDAERPDDDYLGGTTIYRNRVGTTTELTRRAPNRPGRFELRYHINQGRDQRVLGRAAIEVVDGPVEMGEVTDTGEGAEVAATDTQDTAATELADPAEAGIGRPPATDPQDPATQAQLAQLEERINELVERLGEVGQEQQRPLIDDAMSQAAGLGPLAVALIADMMARNLVPEPIGRDLMSAAGTGGAPGVATPGGDGQPGTSVGQQDSAVGVAPDPQPPSAAATTYRVVGVASNEALYLRDAPDPGSAIVGMLPPDATGVQLSGQASPADDGGTWWEIVDATLPGGTGWANARFLEVEAAPAVPAPSQPTGYAHRVVDVAAHDVLNVRQPAGADGTIVGMLPPDATGIELTGRQQQAGGGTWVEIVDPSLPGGTGWVNARFLAPDIPAAGTTESGPTIAAVAHDFVQTEGYSPTDAEAMSNALQATLRDDPQSAFAPGGDLTPLSKAVLLLEAADGVLPHARFRVRYAMAMSDAPPAADPVPMSLIQVDRYNLGPAVRAQLVQAHGEANVAPPEAFGDGPHVSYRFATRPIMGRTAGLVAASRAEPQEPSGSCFGFHCLIGQGIGEHVAEWDGMDRLGPPGFEASYDASRDGALSPAAALDKAALRMGVAQIRDGRLVWTGFEPRESVADGEPFAEAVIEVNLGQDAAIDAVIHDDHIMDHAIAAMWQRIVSVSGDGVEPLVFGAQAVEHRPGQN